jgi:type I restriction enzyme S subunit
MAGEWRDTTLGDFVRLQRGHDLPEAHRRPGVVPIMGSAGHNGFHDTAKAIGPGVVIGRSGVGSMGVVTYCATDYWPHNTVLYVTDFCGNNERFTYYFLHQLNLRRFDSGSAQASLNRNYIYPIRIRVPHPAEQRAIAHILGTLDDKIELNRRMNETLEAMARALFKSWFVDFDPVRAKAEGRDPGLPKPLADLFPARLVDSELGEIPNGWRVASLPEVIDVNPTRPLRKGDVAPYLDMANMPTRGHSPDSVIDRPFASGMRFMNGDTLVARITPCLENGKTAYVDFLDEDQVGWGSTEYIVLHPKSPLPAEFAYCLARGVEFRDFAIQSMTGSSGRQRVPAESLCHFHLVAVPKPIAELFGQLIKPLFACASARAKQSRTLTALRDTLLPKLISGALKVKDAGRFVGARL